MASSKTLVWRGDSSGANGKPNMFEGLCIDAMLPGTLLEPLSTGLKTSVTAATVFTSKPIFANRDTMRQKNMDDVWVVGDSMQAIEFRSGEFGAVLVAASQAITKRRTPLSSNGDGTLKIAATDGTQEIVAYSDEIITTGGSAELVNIYVGG